MQIIFFKRFTNNANDIFNIFKQNIIIKTKYNKNVIIKLKKIFLT